MAFGAVIDFKAYPNEGLGDSSLSSSASYYGVKH